ncbi:MAG: gamma-glutamyl-gamma-aminobutyrate hydrolase family protein [Phycisphaerales bacterium JB065]
MPQHTPLIGITCLVDEPNTRIRRAYADAVFNAGGLPILLPVPREEQRREATARYLDLCDGLVLTGGFDPATERYAQPTDPRVTREHPDRQAFEESLLDRLDDRPEYPVLGVCLGMQLMALHAGGTLNQWMSDSIPSHATHYDDHIHRIIPEGIPSPIPAGEVTSWHRQCVSDAGTMRVVARADDGVIEAIDDPDRPFYLGVQWHPERTTSEPLGLDLFRALIKQCPTHTST